MLLFCIAFTVCINLSLPHTIATKVSLNQELRVVSELLIWDAAGESSKENPFRVGLYFKVSSCFIQIFPALHQPRSFIFSLISSLTFSQMSCLKNLLATTCHHIFCPHPNHSSQLPFPKIQTLVLSSPTLHYNNIQFPPLNLGRDH